MPPDQPESMSAIVDVTNNSVTYHCPQAIYPGEGGANFTTQITGNFSEDCLTLSVYTPVNAAKGGAGLPVVVYLHGGGLSSTLHLIVYSKPLNLRQIYTR